MKHLRNAVLVASVGLIAAGAHAGTETANLTVTATVNSSCTINTSPVNFGSYNPVVTTPTTVSGGVSVACVKGSIPVISLSGGLNPGANAGERAMKRTDGDDKLAYYLYKPASLTAACTGNESSVWGATGADRLEPGAATSISQATYNICGKVPAQQDVATGTYQDTVTATVEF